MDKGWWAGRRFVNKSPYKRLSEYYDIETITWLLSIADEYRTLRESRLSIKWHEYLDFLKTKDVNDLKRSTLRSWREGHHPLGCLNNPFVTSQFVWALAGLIGDGEAVVYHHKEKRLDMFVARLKSKDRDFCYHIKDALKVAGMSASSYPLRGEGKYRCVTYSLIIFSIIKAIREDTERAVEELIKPLLTTRIMKCSFIKGGADSEGYVSIKQRGDKIIGYDIYVFTNSNPVLVEFVSELLEDLEFPHSITRKAGNCRGIRLRTRNPETVLRFYNEIGFTISRKEQVLQRVVNFVKKRL